jgi:hypothetical protein
MDPDVERIEKTLYSLPLVYKYYAPARRQFFERPKVRFSQREALNDPFEMSRRWKKISADGMKDYISSRLQLMWPQVFSRPELLMAVAKESFAEKGIILTDAQCQIVERMVSDQSFLQNQQAAAQSFTAVALEYVFARMEAEFQQLVDNVVSKMGVLSLTEDPLNREMWMHYASMGTGFVVGLDAHHSFFLSEESTTPKNLLRKVLYTDERTENFWRNPYYLFLVKGVGSAFEREWRILRGLSKCDEQNVADGHTIALCRLQPEIIKSVYFGYNYDAAQIQQDVSNIRQFGCAPEFYLVQVNRDTGLLEPQRLDK